MAMVVMMMEAVEVATVAVAAAVVSMPLTSVSYLRHYH